MYNCIVYSIKEIIGLVELDKLVPGLIVRSFKWKEPIEIVKIGITREKYSINFHKITYILTFPFFFSSDIKTPDYGTYKTQNSRFSTFSILEGKSKIVY